MGRKLALVIGNSEYDDAGLARLVTPSEDVTDLASLLQAAEVGDFSEVMTLVNETATTVRKAIARLFKEKGPDDLVLLYFSGHGVLDDQGQLYLAVKDTERDLLSGTAIPASFITGEMDRSRSRRQVLILDCCHSGAFARGSKGAVGASVGTAAAFEGTGYGRVVLTATDATQYAWEGDQVIGRADNSVFTHFMIQGLRSGEADRDLDGRITLDELYDYVYAQIIAKTPKQTPGKWSYRQQGDLVIAKNPHPPVVKAAELPIELKQAIESPFASVREGAARELAQLVRGPNAGLALAAREALQRLSEDDSRKVSIAAVEALKPATSALPGQATPAEPPVPPTARETLPPVVAAVPIVTAAPVEARPAGQDRVVELGAEAEQIAAAELISSGSADIETQKSSAAVASMPVVLLRVLIVTGGWIAGWVSGIFLASIIDSNLATFLGLIAGWSIAAVVTGMILRRFRPAIQLYQIFILIIAWALLPLVGLIMQGGSGSGDSYETSVALIAAIAITWLVNAWFVLPAPPRSLGWQALVIGVAGAIGWVLGGTDKWNYVALRLSGYAWSLPATYRDSWFTAVGLLPNVILSGLIGGGVLALLYGLTQKQAVAAPATSKHARSLEAKQPIVLAADKPLVNDRQRMALLVGVIVSAGWFAGWLAGLLMGSLSKESSSGAWSLALGWTAAGVITGLVLKQVTHSAWWPIAALGASWPLCLVLAFYLNAPGLNVLAVAATWLINSLTAMLVAHNRIWLIAILTSAAAGVVWLIVGNPWDLVALKFFGADYHWALATFLDSEHYGPIDLLLIPALTAAVAGSILTFLLYRRAEALEPL